MFHKLTSLATLPDYILLAGFNNGEYRQFDLKPFINKYPAFKTLTEIPALYEQAKIDVGGMGIVWNDDLDLSAEGVYEKGIPCSPPNDVEKYKEALLAEIVFARKSYGLSQKQLEILSGVAQPCIARTEKGTTDPTLTTMLKMLEPLGLTLSVKQI